MDYEIADRLIKLRKKQGLSQDELADKLSISRQAISKWERAESLPDTENLIALSKLYGITLDELINVDSRVPINGQKKKPRESKNMTKPPTSLIISLICFVVSIISLALIGYFISELVEVLGGYYDHRGQAYVRSEIIGYSIWLGVFAIALVVSIVFGIIFLRKHNRKLK